MLTSRFANLQILLQKEQLDAALISSVPNIIYLTNFNHFFAEEREAFLLMTKNKNYILTDGRYTHAVQTHLNNFYLLEITRDNTFEKLLKRVIADENITILGIEENNLFVSEHKKIATLARTKHISLHTFRQSKTDEEIQLITKACQIGDKAFTYILKKIKIGMSEKEVAFLLETFIRKQGAEISFPAIIAFGENAAFIHHKTGNKKLEMNKCILLDFGVKYENYCSDMSRTIFFGKAKTEQKRMYQTVLEAQKKAINSIKMSLLRKQESMDSRFRGNDKTMIQADAVDKAAREYLISKGFPSFPHSLGHGIGLEVHEAPRLSPQSKDVLADGMVFSIEPGMYVPNKLGIRIEDLFAIQDGSMIQLTKSPRELIEI